MQPQSQKYSGELPWFFVWEYLSQFFICYALQSKLSVRNGKQYLFVIFIKKIESFVVFIILRNSTSNFIKLF